MVCLVYHNARCHHARAVHDWLDGHRSWIDVCWIPPHRSDVNLVERLWGHSKRTVMANVLFSSIHDLVNAFQRGSRTVSANRDGVGFVYDRDPIEQNAA